MKKNYYEILGVSKNATKDEIKKAFHKAAHAHHPDKNGGDDSKFKEANEAYQTLSDDKKRAAYDQFGDNYQQYGGGAGFDPNNYGGGFGFDFSGFQNGQGFDMNDLGDIFGDFFGGGFSGRNSRERGRDLSTEVKISFEESMLGAIRDLRITKTSTCDDCSGKGAKKGTHMKTCTTCSGKGKIRENRQTILGVMATTRVCDLCHGLGQVPEVKCDTCRGYGVYKKDETIHVDIPMGVTNGEMLKYQGKGEATSFGHTGDLYIRVQVSPHGTIQREGNNLIYPLTIKLTTALLGGVEKIKNFDGDIEVKIPAGVSQGEVLRVKEKGVPLSKSKRGDLLIPIKITIPQKLSRKEKDIVEMLKKEGL